MIACRTSTSSTGMPAWICISAAPARMAPKQERGEDDADRVRPAEQGHGDGVEADGRVVRRRSCRGVTPRSVDGARQPGQEAGERSSSARSGAAAACRRSGRRRGWPRRSGSRSPSVVRKSSHQTTRTASEGEQRCPRWPFRPRRIGRAALPDVAGDRLRRDSGVSSGPLTAQATTPQGDVVEHDRGHDLVGARGRLEDARDEAPDGAERASRRAGRAGCAMTVGRRCEARRRRRPRRAAPSRNWPWPPMLNRPALKPRPTDRPPRMSGVASASVLTIAVEAAEGALEEGRDRPRAARPGRSAGR